ncbi:unnamed protein product [Arctogadus glacialis]
MGNHEPVSTERLEELAREGVEEGGEMDCSPLALCPAGGAGVQAPGVWSAVDGVRGQADLERVWRPVPGRGARALGQAVVTTPDADGDGGRERCQDHSQGGGGVRRVWWSAGKSDGWRGDGGVEVVVVVVVVERGRRSEVRMN